MSIVPYVPIVPKFTGLSYVKARSRRLLQQAVETARGLKALESHRQHKDRDQAALDRFLRRYDPPSKAPADDEVRGGSPLEGIPLPDYVPPTWTIEWAATRLVRAWAHVSWGPGRATEGGKSGVWPEYWHSWSDMMGWDEGEFRARPLEDWARRRPQLSAHDLRLNAEAECWPMRYLADHRAEATALQIWLASKVRRIKVSREIRLRLGVSRSTYERDRRTALVLIVDGLTRDGVEVS